MVVHVIKSTDLIVSILHLGTCVIAFVATGCIVHIATGRSCRERRMHMIMNIPWLRKDMLLGICSCGILVEVHSLSKHCAILLYQVCGLPVCDVSFANARLPGLSGWGCSAAPGRTKLIPNTKLQVCASNSSTTVTLIARATAECGNSGSSVD